MFQVSLVVWTWPCAGWDVVGFDGVEPIDVALAATKNAGGNPQVIFHVYLYPPNVYTVEQPLIPSGNLLHSY